MAHSRLAPPLLKFEAQEEACHSRSQRCHPFHQEVLCVQSRARFQDCQTVKAWCPGGAICVEEKKIDKKEKKIGVAALKIMLRQAGLSVSGLHGSLMRRAVECGLLPKPADKMC